jgi:DNA-binding MarR family transcriptional regulator
MQKRTAAEILLAAALLAGAAYFLFYTESGRQWLDRLKNTATEQLDKWLADLEEHLQQLELAEEARILQQLAEKESV